MYDDAQPLNDFYLSAMRADPATGHNIADCRYRRLTIDLQAPPGSGGSAPACVASCARS